MRAERPWEVWQRDEGGPTPRSCSQPLPVMLPDELRLEEQRQTSEEVRGVHLEKFCQKDIIYAFIMGNEKENFLVSINWILQKTYIHKCKIIKVPLKFWVFFNEFLSYIKALKVMKNVSAKKTLLIV